MSNFWSPCYAEGISCAFWIRKNHLPVIFESIIDGKHISSKSESEHCATFYNGVLIAETIFDNEKQETSITINEALLVTMVIFNLMITRGE